MKAIFAKISDPGEKARWQANDIWETMVGHMEQMQKHMEVTPGMMGPGRLNANQFASSRWTQTSGRKRCDP